jgi:preprotein translocase subunit YajC
MGKNRSTDKAHRAMQQRIQAGMNIVTQAGVLSQPSKAELRAMIPAYNESIVRRIETKPRKSKSGKR